MSFWKGPKKQPSPHLDALFKALQSRMGEWLSTNEVRDLAKEIDTSDYFDKTATSTAGDLTRLLGRFNEGLNGPFRVKKDRRKNQVYWRLESR